MRQRAQQQLSGFIQRKRHSRSKQHNTLGLGTSGQQPHFTPERHGLSQELCNEANRLLRKAQQERPLSGTIQQVHFRFACRCGGILSAIKRKLVANSRFGRSLHAHRGGRVMQRRGMHILQAIYPVGLLAIQMARERKRAAQFYEEHGEVLPLGASPTETPEQARLRTLNDLWEHSVWQQQRDRLRW